MESQIVEMLNRMENTNCYRELNTCSRSPWSANIADSATSGGHCRRTVAIAVAILRLHCAYYSDAVKIEDDV